MRLLCLLILTCCFGAAASAQDATYRSDEIGALFSDFTDGEGAERVAAIERLLELDPNDIVELPRDQRAFRTDLALALFEEGASERAMVVASEVLDEQAGLIAAEEDRASVRYTVLVEERIETLRLFADAAIELPDIRIAWLAEAYTLHTQLASDTDPSVIPFVEAYLDAVADAGGTVDCDAWRANYAARCPDAARLANLRLLAELEGDSLETLGPDVSDDEVSHKLTLFFASTRGDNKDQTDPFKAFNQRPGREFAATYGTLDVSVPKSRTPGSLPPARGVKNGEEGKHIILRRVERLGVSVFTEAFGASLNEDPTRREAFIFVHGHATSFSGAARRTAQLAVDLDMMDGAVFYAWPAATNIWDYGGSENAWEFAVPGLVELIKLVHAEADTVHLIAHSMGTRVLLEALDKLEDDATFDAFDRAAPPFKNVFWASADKDQSLFESEIKTLRGAADQMVLYASARDLALPLPKMMKFDRPRAGQIPPTPGLASLIEVVDTSELGGLMALNHDDFGNDALPDLQAVIWHSLAPHARCILNAEPSGTSAFWKYGEDAACDEDAFSLSMQALRQTELDPVTWLATARDDIAPPLRDKAAAIVSELSN
jgi:esterase/lipase superfamily enzyme